jgi:hypothetical protein
LGIIFELLRRLSSPMEGFFVVSISKWSGMHRSYKRRMASSRLSTAASKPGLGSNLRRLTRSCTAMFPEEGGHRGVTETSADGSYEMIANWYGRTLRTACFDHADPAERSRREWTAEEPQNRVAGQYVAFLQQRPSTEHHPTPASRARHGRTALGQIAMRCY